MGAVGRGSRQEWASPKRTHDSFTKAGTLVATPERPQAENKNVVCRRPRNVSRIQSKPPPKENEIEENDPGASRSEEAYVAVFPNAAISLSPAKPTVLDPVPPVPTCEKEKKSFRRANSVPTIQPFQVAAATVANTAITICKASALRRSQPSEEAWTNIIPRDKAPIGGVKSPQRNVDAELNKSVGAKQWQDQDASGEGVEIEDHTECTSSAGYRMG